MANERQSNQMRSMLHGFYPATLIAFGDDRAGCGTLAALGIAATPNAGRPLSRSKVAAALAILDGQRDDHRGANRRCAAQ